jgi:hypothetical protein
MIGLIASAIGLLQDRPLLVPVLIHPNLNIVQRSSEGVVARQGQISTDEVNGVIAALEGLQTRSQGRIIFKSVVDPTEIYLGLDEADWKPSQEKEVAFGLDEAAGSPFDRLLRDSAAPRFASDPPDSGAFLLIHGGATAWSGVKTLNGRPLIIASYHELAGGSPSQRIEAALGALLAGSDSRFAALAPSEALPPASPFIQEQNGWISERPILSGALPIWQGSHVLAEQDAIRFQAGWTEGEALSLRLRFQDGPDAFLRLQTPVQKPVEAAKAEEWEADAASGQPLAVSAAPWTGRTLVEAALTAGSYPGSHQRRESGRFQISAIQFSISTGDARQPRPAGPATVAQELRSRSIHERLTALEPFRGGSEVPDILLLRARGLNSAEAFWSAQILKTIKTPESDDVLDQMIRRGPLSVSRDAASEAAIDRPALLPALRVLAFARTWPSRAAAARALGASAVSAYGLALAGMGDDPEPAVRWQAARSLQLSMEETLPRLRFMTANDTSSWVRAAAAIRLMDLPDSPARQEAIRAVRDPDPFVRRTLLERMGAGRPEDRPALRLAVLDPLPELRALALRAFSRQPGPVQLGEIENVLKDADPAVQRALADLAREKGLQLPPPTTTPDSGA